MKNKNKLKYPKSGYWYKFVINECVLCGRGKTYKYRVYDVPKPLDNWMQYDYNQNVCHHHFM